MSGFLNILLSVMNGRQREREIAAQQPYRDAQLKQLNLQNQEAERNVSDLNAIRQASQQANQGQAQFIPAEGNTLSSMSNVFNTPGEIKTVKGDPAMAGMKKAMELGRTDYAANYAQVVDLQDKLDEMVARNKTWGGSEQYHSIKSQLDTASQTGKMLNELHKSGGMGMIRQVLSQNPELQKIVGDPEKLIFNQEGVMHPALHAQTKEPIPNWFYMVDQDGKTKMVEVKPNQEDLIDKRFENQLKLTTMMQDRQDARQNRQLASMESRAARTAAAKSTGTGGGGKPLPVAALKLQKEELDAIGTTASINAGLAKIDQQIANGELNLSPMSNLAAKGQNLAGISTKSSRNYASFKATLEKLRNDSLRLNKGVQTDGDAQRAWKELIEGINDPKLVRQRLKEIQEKNLEAADLRRNNIDVIRSNYGASPLNLEKFENVRGASAGGPGAGAIVKKLDATTAQKFLRQAGGNKDKAREMARKAGFSF